MAHDAEHKLRTGRKSFMRENIGVAFTKFWSKPHWKLKKKLGDRNPSNLEEAESIATEEWCKIPVCVYSDIVRDYQKRINGNNQK